MGITVQRRVAWVTVAKPAAAKMLRLPVKRVPAADNLHDLQGAVGMEPAVERSGLEVALDGTSTPPPRRSPRGGERVGRPFGEDLKLRPLAAGIALVRS